MSATLLRRVLAVRALNGCLAVAAQAQIPGSNLLIGRSDDDRADFGRAAAYQRLTQRWAEWDRDGLGVRVGNFYTILGRGLLH